VAVSRSAFRRYRRSSAASCCGWDAGACGAPSPRSVGPARASRRSRVQPPPTYGPCRRRSQSAYAGPALPVA